MSLPNEPDIFQLAKKFQCHSHGYMCQDCPQPDEAETVDLLKKYTVLVKRQALQSVFDKMEKKKKSIAHFTEDFTLIEEMKLVGYNQGLYDVRAIIEEEMKP